MIGVIDFLLPCLSVPQTLLKKKCVSSLINTCQLPDTHIMPAAPHFGSCKSRDKIWRLRYFNFNIKCCLLPVPEFQIFIDIFIHNMVKGKNIWWSIQSKGDGVGCHTFDSFVHFSLHGAESHIHHSSLLGIRWRILYCKSTNIWCRLYTIYILLNYFRGNGIGMVCLF